MGDGLSSELHKTASFVFTVDGLKSELHKTHLLFYGDGLSS